MGRYTGYLVVSDMDGTLIDSMQNVSRENIEAISYYVEEGGLFAVATGRTELNVGPFVKDIKINCPCILYNGSAIYDLYKKKFFNSIFLDKSILLETLKEIMAQYQSTCIQIYTPGKLFIITGMDTMDPVLIEEKQTFELASPARVVKKDWFKIIFRDTNPTLKSIEQLLERRIPEGCLNSVYSCPTYLELLTPGVSKGSALLTLTNIMNVEPGKVIAIGDYCNDLEMIQTAGLGVATANAHPLLKEAAGAISVSNDEHAICHLINKIIPEYERKSMLTDSYV